MKVRLMKLSLHCLMLLLFALQSAPNVCAQPNYWLNKKKSYNWMLSSGASFLDDDGQGYEQLFAIKTSWHMVPYPNFFSVDRFMSKGWSWVATASYNQYNPKKLYNGEYGYSGHFVSADFGFKLSLYPWLKGIIDPYLVVSAGATYRSVKSVAPTVPTVGGSAGLNFWINKRWALQFQSTAKLGIDVTALFMTNTNYMQHSVGLVYKTGMEKPRNSFGKKKYKWTHTKQRYRFKDKK